MADELHIKSEMNQKKKLKIKCLGRVQHNMTYNQRRDVYGDKSVILLAASQKMQFLLQNEQYPK